MVSCKFVDVDESLGKYWGGLLFREPSTVFHLWEVTQISPNNAMDIFSCSVILNYVCVCVKPFEKIGHIKSCFLVF